MSELTTEKKSQNVSVEEYEAVKKELAHAREREQIVLRKFDRMQGKQEWMFRHPFRFVIGRIYHQYIKRDQKNVKN